VLARVEQPGVRVAHHAQRAHGMQPLQRLARLRPGHGHVAQRDDPVDRLALQRSQHRFERDQVPVNVGQDGNAHPRLLGLGSAENQSYHEQAQTPRGEDVRT